MYHRYSPEQIEYLKKTIKGRKIPELTKMFNAYFGLTLKESQIRSCTSSYGIKSGIDTRFKKGQPPFNKGMKGISFGGKQTQFKEGNVPHNYRPVGSERIDTDGYAYIKVDNHNKWVLKHRLIWEHCNGTIPKGHNILFGDGDKTNFDIDNLVLVSKKQLAIMNKNHLIQDDADLTRTGVMIADLRIAIKQRREAQHD